MIAVLFAKDFVCRITDSDMPGTYVINWYFEYAINGNKPTWL